VIKWHVGTDRNVGGDRRLDAPIEARGVDHVIAPSHVRQRGQIPLDVEGLRRAFHVGQVQPCQLGVGQVEAVHRQGSGAFAEVGEQRSGHRALSTAGLAGDAEKPAASVHQ
jgi:hypothetical protein